MNVTYFVNIFACDGNGFLLTTEHMTLAESPIYKRLVIISGITQTVCLIGRLPFDLEVLGF